MRQDMRGYFLPSTTVLLLVCLLQVVIATPLNEFNVEGEWIQADRKLLSRRDGNKVTVFEHAATQSRLEYVSDSGICETTKGVRQHSGYLTVGDGMNMWFWMFEARKDPANAPLVAWFNGGPGCSSMIGLFQEHGPCQFYNNAQTPSNNKYSWNEYANMIYIDQPVGVGFSYGTNDVSSSVTASPYVWKLIQNFYASFPEYKSREFGIFTESYGGHYGPEFARYIQSQNKAIDSGSLKAQKINLTALGINNGWINPADNYKALIDYAYNNTYKKLITQQQWQSYTATFEQRCKPLLQTCWQTNSNADCQRAMVTCKSGVENPLARGNFDVYDVRQPAKDPFPPQTYIKYLDRQEIVSAIGAKSKYQECPTGPLRKFSATGDDSRNFLPALNGVVNSGVQVLIWAGDTDWICNWMGNLATANTVKYPGQSRFANAPLVPYNVNGKKKGLFKNVDNLSFLNVFEAGHEAAYYQPEASLQAFIQTMQKKPIFST